MNNTRIFQNFNNFQTDIPLANYTTLGIGGPAKLFVKVTSVNLLKEVIKFAQHNYMDSLVVGSGSNLLVSDNGFNGIVIKNCIRGIKISNNKISANGGMLLQDLVDAANKKGLRGLEKLAGIPGTVAGAIYGNAGAYGQSISEKLTRVGVLDRDKEYWINKTGCGFDYRNSNFKENKNLVILEAEFILEKDDPKLLVQTSAEISKIRLEKYPNGIKCPGSFFKNVITQNLSQENLEKIPADKIAYGKIPAGYLLEMVGAKGARKGSIKIADFHANLIINEGLGTSVDFLELAWEYKDKVKNKFGVELELEVQLVGFD